MLKPNGLFIFDVFTNESYKGKHENTNWYMCEHGGFLSEKSHLCMEAMYLYENNSVSASQYIVVTKDSVKECIVWDTVYSPKDYRMSYRYLDFV